MTIYDVPINDLILKAAEELKSIKEIMPPSWADFVKTGMHKQRPPVQKDWWYVRAAAILRSVNKLGPVGVSKLRVKYGGRKNRGAKPEKFCQGSGNILRKILQQLEAAGLVVKAEKGVRKGRVITPKGLSLLDKAASALMTDQKITIPKKSTEEIAVALPKKKKKAKKKTIKKTTRKRTRKAKKTEEAPPESPVEEAPAEEAQAEEKPEQAEQ